MTTLERLNEKKEEIKTQLQLCEFACKIQTLLDERKKMDDMLRGDIDSFTWLRIYEDQKSIESKINKEFNKASKVFEIKIEKKDSVYNRVSAWNSFCVTYNHWDFYLNY